MKSFIQLSYAAFAAIFFSGLGGGCSREKNVTGQVFIVTKGRENLKLGLVGIHLVSNDEVKKVAAKVVDGHRNWEVERARQKVEEESLRQFESDLEKMVPSGVSVEGVEALLRKSREWREKSRAPSRPASLTNKKRITDRLFGELPTAVVETDADGQFVVRATPEVWLIARAERKTHEGDESYVWMLSITKTTKGRLLLSNNTLMEEDGLLKLLGNVSGVALDRLPIPLKLANPEIDTWIKESKARAIQMVEAAKAKLEVEEKERERLAAEAKAKQAAEEMERQQLATEVKKKVAAERKRLWSGHSYQGVSITRPGASSTEGGFYPEPDYPTEAARLKEEGTVILLVIIDADGTVITSKLHESAGSPTLDRHAVQFVKKRWKWPPGEPRQNYVPIEFHLP